MEEFLEAVAQSLRNMGLPATADGAGVSYCGVRVSAYPSYRRGQGVVLGGELYRPEGRGRSRGYDVAAAVRDLLEALPRRLEALAKAKQITSLCETFKELTGADAREGQQRRICENLHVSWDSEGFHVKVSGKDLANLLVMCDMIQERWL